MREYIETIGVIVASVTAVYGINTWRRELRGKKEHDLAEEVLAIVYQCRDNLRAIRSPASYTDEGSTRSKNPTETPDETKILNRAYIAFERYEKHKEPFNRLFALRYRFMALFGREAAQPIEDLRIALNDVFIAAQMLPSYWQEQGRRHPSEEAFEEHMKEMQSLQKTFWGTFSSKDGFDVKVNGIVSRFELTCARILRPEPAWRNRQILTAMNCIRDFCGRKREHESTGGQQPPAD